MKNDKSLTEIRLLTKKMSFIIEINKHVAILVLLRKIK